MHSIAFAAQVTDADWKSMPKDQRIALEYLDGDRDYELTEEN